jgi:dienelactone hydrolase
VYRNAVASGAARVTFTSGEVPCTGYLFHPGGLAPGVVLAQGFSGTQDRLVDVAERFRDAGLAAFTFDYRGFGESSGEPRQVVTIGGQLEDLRAAVDVVRRAPDVDPGRVALWGSSLGGAHVAVVAADDPRVAAVVAQMPFNGFPSRVDGRSSADTRRLLAAILRDAVRGWLGRSPFYIPMIAGPGEVAVTSTTDARAYLDVLAGESVTWRNQVAPRGLLGMMRYHPDRAAKRMAMPLLVCAAESDEATPLELVRRLADSAPRGALLTYPGTHFEFYRDAETRRRVVDDQIGFLRRHLLGSR